MTKRKSRLRAWHVLISVIVVIMVATCGFLLWSYKPEVVALDALIDTCDIRVTNSGKQIVFEPVTDCKAGIIFYPGANVDSRAYAPLMRELANRGILVVVAVMPHEMAFLDADAADLILEKYGSLTDKWYISGHSLGGSMAGSYLSKNTDKLDGIILLAAYSTDNIDVDGISALTIYGSEDHVLNLERLEKYKINLPSDSVMHVIEGGNHANFAYYGNQFGDGDATISKEDQIQETASVIEEFIDNH